MKKFFNPRLKTSLFLIPLTSLVLAFILIFLVFNLTIRQYIETSTASAISQQFDTLDQLYQSTGTSQQLDTSNQNQAIFSTQYLITTDDFEEEYSSISSNDSKQKKVSKQLLKFLSNEEDDIEHQLEAEKGIIVTIDGSSYYLKAKEYWGAISDYYVTDSKDDDDDDASHLALVYTNITPIQDFLNLINNLLLGLMVLTGGLAFVLIFLTAKKIDTAFQNLRDFILKVGRREKTDNISKLAYQEFNQVADTVQEMSNMIEQSQASQRYFFQNSSHELRTPLMSIQGYAEAIKEGIGTNPKESAQIILDESQRMTKLVDDILLLSKLEGSQSQLHIEEINTKELIVDCSWRLKSLAEERSLSFVHKLEDYLFIQGDEEKLERAITNILSNAIRYARSTITICSLEIDDCFQIIIKNDGPKIPEKDLEHIFDRFYKGQDGQHGIGLAITKEIISIHGGDITVSSTSEQTVFTLILPKAPLADR